jgi:L-asparaginase
MKNVRLIATGGTIASDQTADRTSVTASKSGHDLLARLHDPLDGIAVTVEEFSSVGSYALDLPTVHALIGRIRAALDSPDCDGIVVTHGTDTMEESAFLADLLIASDKPVVFTGAQRHAGDPDSDGPRNIADAVHVAASAKAVGLGTMIVFEGDIHAARTVMKAHTSRTDTFRSTGYGKLGEIDRYEVHLTRRPFARQTVPDHGVVAEVELIKVALGSRPDYLRFCAANGARGIVIEAFGRGNAPVGFGPAIADLVAQGIPIIVASRCIDGRAAPIYGNDSGGATLSTSGAIFAGELSAIKARLLLSVLLAANQTMDAISTAFALY